MYKCWWPVVRVYDWWVSAIHCCGWSHLSAPDHLWISPVLAIIILSLVVAIPGTFLVWAHLEKAKPHRVHQLLPNQLRSALAAIPFHELIASGGNVTVLAFLLLIAFGCRFQCGLKNIKFDAKNCNKPKRAPKSEWHCRCPNSRTNTVLGGAEHSWPYSYHPKHFTYEHELKDKVKPWGREQLAVFCAPKWRWSHNLVNCKN